MIFSQNVLLQMKAWIDWSYGLIIVKFFSFKNQEMYFWSLIEVSI